MGQSNYFNYLESKPRDIISKLVFISKNYSQAEKLASHFKMDLVLAVLSSIDAPGRLVSSEVAGEAGTCFTNTIVIF